MLKGLITIILKALPLETIVAHAVSYMLAKITEKKDPVALEQIAKSAVHIAEVVAVLNDVLEDGTLTATEVSESKQKLFDLRMTLLNVWAKQRPAKGIEKAIAEHDL